MKPFKYIFIIAACAGFLTLLSNPLHAQTKARVENVDFFLEGDNLIITYDIVKASTGETFDVSVNISTQKGTPIKAYALSGDYGKGVYGGNFKRIAWDLAKDNVVIDDEIFVEVFLAESNPFLSPKSNGKVSVGGAMLRSLVFPGWGNNYAKGGGAYWLIGVAAYGSAGAAVYFNNQAYNKYEDYKISLDAAERDQLYQDASDSQDMQKNMMIVAGAIWITDIIWSGLQAGNVNKKARKSNVSVGYYYDPAARTPMFSVSYQFK
ncbi:MAG: hypothetical protein K9H16_04150 [Bacteroidales bacterium]|nr:hypothetical protein [Bacteroidales bacterium]